VERPGLFAALLLLAFVAGLFVWIGHKSGHAITESEFFSRDKSPVFYWIAQAVWAGVCLMCVWGVVSLAFGSG
jgi:hypothetical protein